MFKESAIAEQYSQKMSSYNSKYGTGYYTHIHTGLYDQNEMPGLFCRHESFHKFGLERLKHLLVSGQERLTSRLARMLIDSCPSSARILDCGAGHGGTTIHLVENYGVDVSALTLADSQAKQIKSNAEKACVSKKISVIVGNVFKHNFGSSGFDAIIGTDAFCQMGNPQKLYKILSKLLNPGGVIVLSDYFVSRKSNSFIPRFNSYWQSDITTVSETLDGVNKTQLQLTKFDNITPKQAPFWRLSIAHSEILLEKNCIDSEERRRLKGSLKYHREMSNAFEDGFIHYCQMCFKREGKT
jgi:cyclopropane fatty-acyl-phospholipid synthase-like methyltransferase